MIAADGEDETLDVFLKQGTFGYDDTTGSADIKRESRTSKTNEMNWKKFF